MGAWSLGASGSGTGDECEQQDGAAQDHPPSCLLPGLPNEKPLQPSERHGTSLTKLKLFIFLLYLTGSAAVGEDLSPL